MSNLKLTFDIQRTADKLYKAEASKIDPKSGTSASFLQYYVIAGKDAIKMLKADKEPEIKANEERLSKKYADEANAPIIAEMNKEIEAIKDNVLTRFNAGIDARIQQINLACSTPIRDGSMKQLQTIRMLVEMEAPVSESDWKLWSNQFTGYYLEEKVFSALAKKAGIDILPTFYPEKSIERLEEYREAGLKTIAYLDKPEQSLLALSFLNTNNPDSPISKLIADIDSDFASIIPAEKLTVLRRLNDAKQNAYDKDNVALSVKIGSFIDRNIDKLASPAELNESLFAQAEEFINQGMNAKKE